MTLKKHEIKKECSDLLKQKHAPIERETMALEDSRSSLIRDLEKFKEIKKAVEF
jgi:hypothetical protein